MKMTASIERITAFTIKTINRSALLCALCLLLIIPAAPPSLFAAEGEVHHDLKVTLAPNERRFSAIDTITLPKNSSPEITFLLHSGLRPRPASPSVRIRKRGQQNGAVQLEAFNVIIPSGLRTFTIEYEGSIYHPLDNSGTAQARGFQETPGIIFENGVFLSPSSAWYPDLGPGLMTFDLEITLPPAWDAVSQGERTLHDIGGDRVRVRWKSPEPQEGIYLVANRFYEFSRPAKNAVAMAFLRGPDRALAAKYLAATRGYLGLYTGLIGPYPYKKFALVENFWETGYGMPSFTLLGPTVIRLPFIINTSYPHEILHNWWGNSVYPDYEQGNWSEGLTAYLADHLMKEQEGGGREYRLSTLQKYADYVSGSKDFPLTQFRSRHSSSSEAIGYGKGLMFFHMLRLKLGDAAFKQGLRDFYRDYKFRFAAYGNIRTSFEAASGLDLKQEFDQWVTRTGAPRLKAGKPHVAAQGKRFILTMRLDQIQPGNAYLLHVPVAVTLAGQEKAFQTVMDLKDRNTELAITLPAKPLRLDVDPEFDVFRRLDRRETPPAISEALGAKKILIVLPGGADNELLAAYRSFAKVLAESGPDEAMVKLDSEIADLPQDRSIAIIGWENRFLPSLAHSLSGYGIALTPTTTKINQIDIPRKNHAVVFAARLSPSSGHALLFIASSPTGALPGLGRKLPHYHKYGYLAFEGQEPANTAKGLWPVEDSPMTVFVPDEQGKIKKVGMGKLVLRAPLASPVAE